MAEMTSAHFFLSLFLRRAFLMFFSFMFFGFAAVLASFGRFSHSRLSFPSLF